MYHVLADLPAVPETDIGFAISADSANASMIFTLMKETISSVIEQYGQSRLRYSVIVFGSTPTIKVSFSDLFANKDQLKTLVAAVPRSRGSNLAKTLQEAKNMFQGSAGVDTNKILVIMTDRKSDSGEKELAKNVKELEDEGVTVLGVVFGDQSNQDELEKIVPNKQDVIKQGSGVESNALAGKIMERALKGWIFF